MDIEKSLCTLLKMVFDAFPLDATNTPQDIRLLYSKVVELIQNHLAVVTAPQVSHDTSSANLMISFAVSVIKTLAEGQQDFIDSFMMPLIRVLQRLTSEIRMLTSSIAKQVWLIFYIFLFCLFFIKCFFILSHA
jgi:transformation/transcription domain-associated protein